MSTGYMLISAIEQIDSTIDILQAELIEHTINARIVLSKVTTPDLRNSKYIKLERKLKQNNGTIQKGTRVLEEKL